MWTRQYEPVAMLNEDGVVETMSLDDAMSMMERRTVDLLDQDEVLLDIAIRQELVH